MFNCFDCDDCKCKKKKIVVERAGKRGATGPTGPQGEADTIVVAETFTSEAGMPAQVLDEVIGNQHTLRFVIPRGVTGPGGGEKGDKGDPGEADTIEIGETVTLTPDTPAQVLDNKVGNNHTLIFAIPKGETGEKGEKGATGSTGATGPAGATGISETITIGQTYTGDAGVSASVTDRTGSPNHTLDFVIPKGEDAVVNAAYFVTLTGPEEGITIPDGGYEIKAGGRIPIARKEMDLNNGFAINSNSSILFNKTGSFEVTFIVNGVCKHGNETFDPKTHFASVGFRAIDGAVVFVGANQWSSEDEPHQIVGTGMFVVNSIATPFELVNLSDKSLYLFAGDKAHTSTSSYFTTPVVTIKIKQFR